MGAKRRGKRDARIKKNSVRGVLCMYWAHTFWIFTMSSVEALQASGLHGSMLCASKIDFRNSLRFVVSIQKDPVIKKGKTS